MPHGDWDDVSPAGKAALRALLAIPGGRSVAGLVKTGEFNKSHPRWWKRFTVATWRSLARYSLIRSKDETITYDSEVWITQEGKDAIVDTSKTQDIAPASTPAAQAAAEQPERLAKILLFPTKP